MGRRQNRPAQHSPRNRGQQSIKRRRRRRPDRSLHDDQNRRSPIVPAASPAGDQQIGGQTGRHHANGLRQSHAVAQKGKGGGVWLGGTDFGHDMDSCGLETFSRRSGCRLRDALYQNDGAKIGNPISH
jgi:hypothetical protein